jgi:hypothetical protein
MEQNQSSDPECVENELMRPLAIDVLDFIDRAWKTGNFQNAAHGPANATFLVSRMVEEIKRLKSEITVLESKLAWYEHDYNPSKPKYEGTNNENPTP